MHIAVYEADNLADKHVKVLERVSRQDRDEIEGSIVRVRAAQTVHHPGGGRQAVASLATRSMEKLRPVDTDTDSSVVALEKLAPVRVDQRCVGLKTVANRHHLGDDLR